MVCRHLYIDISSLSTDWVSPKQRRYIVQLDEFFIFAKFILSETKSIEGRNPNAKVSHAPKKRKRDIQPFPVCVPRNIFE
jgi:hypothetical protein